MVIELEREMRRSGQPWQFVAIFPGQLQPLSVFDGNRLPAPTPPLRQARPMTVVAFWRVTGHSLVETVAAGDGNEALHLAQVRYGTARELQVLAAFPGQVTPLLVSEQRPSLGWQVQERRA